MRYAVVLKISAVTAEIKSNIYIYIYIYIYIVEVKNNTKKKKQAKKA